MSRRLAFIVLILSVALSACMPGLSPIPAGDSQATAMALAGTMVVQTMAALPTPTVAPTNAPLPTLTVTTAPSATEATNTATFTPGATSTVNSTVTATGSATGAVTISTVPNTVVGTITATLTVTPGPLLWGTVPPSVPYARVHLVNLTNQMVYISFHCTLENGLTSYLEYPVYARITVSIPTGPCHYVAWVKGQQFTGDIRIKKFEEYTFTFKKTKILVTQP
jgi:hypothetical protein